MFRKQAAYFTTIFTYSILLCMLMGMAGSAKETFSHGQKPSHRYARGDGFIKTRVITTDHTGFNKAILFDHEHGYVFKLFHPQEKSRSAAAQKFRFYKRSISNKRIQLKKIEGVTLIFSNYFLEWNQLITLFSRPSHYHSMMRSVLVALFDLANASMRH